MSWRLIQNFSGSRAILCLEANASADALTRTLSNLGLTVEKRHPGEQAFEDPSSLNPDRDVLFVDGDIDAGSIWPVPYLNLNPPAPVIGLVGHEAPSRLKTLLQCGATALLRKPVLGAGVYSALFAGVNAYRHRRHLEERLKEHESKRRGRRSLIKAIVHLVRHEGLDDEAAYEFLRKESMHSRQSVEAFCETYIRQLDCRETEAFGAPSRHAACAAIRSEGRRS
jgi:two-component system, response regulator PdtaR